MIAMMSRIEGSVFTSSASQHGGQETTLFSMMTFLFHQGMVVVGVHAVRFPSSPSGPQGRSRGEDDSLVLHLVGDE